MSRHSKKLTPEIERANLLIDIYGELLTEKQKRFVRLHYGQNLSFGEIAAQYNVSRQAIYDAVKHALSKLERYEKALSLLSKSRAAESAQVEANSGVAGVIAAPNLTDIISDLERLQHKVRKQNIIYNVDWIVNDLSRIISAIKKS